jgi:hypothetical protein
MDTAKSIMGVVRAFGAIVAGYAVIVALTTAGFTGWLENANLYLGGISLILKGMLVAVVAGVTGGYVAALIGGRRPLLHAALVLLPLAADSFYVFFVFPRQTPLWFEVIASAGLMAATLAGGVLRTLQKRTPASADVVPAPS